MYDGAENALYKRVGIRARCGVMHADALVPSSFSRDSLQLWFSPWRTLVPSSVEILVLPVPHGPKIFLRRRSAALRRSAPSARRTALVSRPHISHLRARTARRTHPERAARTESGRAPPSGPERCNRTIAAPDGDLRPLLPRRCTPRLGCRNAVRRRTSTTVLTKQTKPSVPDRGIQLKG